MQMEAPKHRQLLETLASARTIPFRPELLPHRREAQLSSLHLSALHWRGSGPPVLLLHGGALAAHTWDLVCLALGDEAQCVALDLPGHGHSGWRESYGIDSGVADVREFIDRLEWPTLHLVGMSLGGNIAFHLAASQPERVRSLTIVDVGPRVNLGATDNMRRFLLAADKFSQFEDLLAAALAVSSRKDSDLLRYRYESLVRVNPDGTWQWLQHRHPHDFEDTLAKLREMPPLAPRIRCPVLIVRGGRSRVISEQDARQFAAMFTHGNALMVPDAGHNVQEDNPKALAEALRSHFRAAESVSR
jgi:pimeloyl-ACP methyl ester carboxylesterase